MDVKSEKEHLLQIMQKVHRFMTNKSLCDLEVYIENGCFHLHKCIFAAASPLLHYLMLQALESCKNGVPKILLHGITMDGFKSVVRYIYTGKAPTDHTSENWKSFVNTCQYLSLPYPEVDNGETIIRHPEEDVQVSLSPRSNDGVIEVAMRKGAGVLDEDENELEVPMEIRSESTDGDEKDQDMQHEENGSTFKLDEGVVVTVQKMLKPNKQDMSPTVVPKSQPNERDILSTALLQSQVQVQQKHAKSSAGSTQKETDTVNSNLVNCCGRVLIETFGEMKYNSETANFKCTCCGKIYVAIKAASIEEMEKNKIEAASNRKIPIKQRRRIQSQQSGTTKPLSSKPEPIADSSPEPPNEIDFASEVEVYTPHDKQHSETFYATPTASTSTKGTRQSRRIQTQKPGPIADNSPEPPNEIDFANEVEVYTPQGKQQSETFYATPSVATSTKGTSRKNDGLSLEDRPTISIEDLMNATDVELENENDSATQNERPLLVKKSFYSIDGVYRPFFCDYCGGHFARRHEFKTHQEDYCGEIRLTVKCLTCNKDFIGMRSFRNHAKRLHPGENVKVTKTKKKIEKKNKDTTESKKRRRGQYLCEICDTSHGTESNFNFHREKCEKINKFKCPECPRGFRSRIGWEKHIWQVHQIRD